MISSSLILKKKKKKKKNQPKWSLVPVVVIPCQSLPFVVPFVAVDVPVICLFINDLLKALVYKL